MREGTALLTDRIAGPLTAEQQDIVDILDVSSCNLQKLIEQLLDYNRKLADAHITLAPVELAPLVERVISAHSLPARAKGMHTHVTIRAAHCYADCAINECPGQSLFQSGALRG